MSTRRISRREFLKFAAVGGLLAGGLPACQSVAPPTVTLRKPEVIRFYPDAPSKVVRAHHAGVWNGDDLAPEALRQMLDASITALTGLDGARDAWAALFRPTERVAIKVNTYGGSFGGSVVFTHVPLVSAVAQALQEVGVPAEQIVIYDMVTSDLEGAGFAINRDGPGVRCTGTQPDWEEPGDYVTGWTLYGKDIGLSQVLAECDALINMPVLKTHSHAGLTFALKNHYGSFDRPGDFHLNLTVVAIPELNALPPIKERTRLIIGDALETACLRGSLQWPDWSISTRGDSIFVSFDPVAHDTLGLQLAGQLAAESGESTTAEQRIANGWLRNAAQLGLGTNDPNNIELVEMNLG